MLSSFSGVHRDNRGKNCLHPGIPVNSSLIAGQTSTFVFPLRGSILQREVKTYSEQELKKPILILFYSFKFVYAGNYVYQKELGECIFQSRKTSWYLLFHQASKKRKRGAIHVMCEI